MAKKPKKVLNVFLLAMMNVAIILSLRGLPLMAKEGLSLIFYLTFILVVFLIPSALVSAELATGWPEEGGVFRWVKEAFGEKMGFLAIFLQWFQNLFWYPAVLAFTAGALAYLFGKPGLAFDPWYNVAVILLIYWGSTYVTLHGVKASGWISTSGVLIGTLLPGALIIILGFLWWLTGNPIAFMDADPKWIPDFSSFSKISLLAGIFLLFSGIEVNAVHAMDVKNPTRSYPMAILISCVVIFSIFLLGSLALAAVLPQGEISLTAGIMQGMSQLLELYHLKWMLPVIGLFLAYGAIGGVVAWISGPSKGMLATAKYGMIPPFLAKENEDGIQSNILVLQGVIISILSLLFVVAPTVGTAFFLMTDLGVMLYLIMYILLYVSALVLRYKAPNVKRLYKIPGGNLGIWIVCGVGILGALFAMIIGFFPPEQLEFSSTTFYVSFLIGGIIFALLSVYLIIKFRKRSWKKKLAK